MSEDKTIINCPIYTKEEAMRVFDLVEDSTDKRALPISLVAGGIIALMESLSGHPGQYVDVQEYLSYINQRRVTELSEFNTGHGIKHLYREAAEAGYNKARDAFVESIKNGEFRRRFLEEWGDIHFPMDADRYDEVITNMALDVVFLGYPKKEDT